MTDFRFQFLQRDFPALAALCEQAERADDLHTALLKMRMALENMVNDMGAKQKELFGKINELNDQGILDAKRSQLFHQVRRTSNLGVHEGNEIGAADVKACLDALFEITLWYAISFKKKRYELADFQTADMGLVKQYLNNHAPEGEKPASSEQAQDFFSNSIDPLQIEGDFSQLLEKNEETDELEQDVFETDEEYAERIASLPKVHLGYAILDTRRKDGYTKIVFPLHHIDRNDRIHFSNNIRAFYTENITGDDVIDDELVSGLRVFGGQVYCNYSTIALKHGNEEIPLHPICWEKFPYETDMDLQDRINQMPVLPLGLCLPDRNSYNLHTQTLTFTVKPFAYVQEKLALPNITLKIDRDLAKEICAKNHPYKIFGRFEDDDGLFILWDKEFGVLYDGLNAHDRTGKQTQEQSKDNAETFVVPDLSAEKLFQLGENYFKGIEASKNIKKGIKYYKKAAEKGSLKAQLALGNRYRQGIDVEKNEREAFRWYWQAAGQGNDSAQDNIGDLYRLGQGVKQDYEEAMKWYQKAAKQGNATAQKNIGYLYNWGYGVKRDYKEAMKWYRKAAEQGNATAQKNIGYLYECGHGVEQDYQEAMEWYQKACKQGDKSAKKNLARMRKALSIADTPQKRSSGKKSSGCFITTAVCKCFGKPDDCYELTMFRGFRDNWLVKQPDGEALIAEYYAIAPTIVSCIDQMASSADIYQQIWQRYLAPCLKHLEQGENEACKERYVDMVRTLKARYC